MDYDIQCEEFYEEDMMHFDESEDCRMFEGDEE